MFETLIVHWGYLAVALGTFVEGETVLFAAGALAHKGLLSLPFVIGAATVGSVAWAQLWFRIGARLGRAGLERRPALRARALEVERFLMQRGALFVVTFRFLTGMGTAAPMLLGAFGFPAGRFARLDPIGALLWASAFSAGGWGLGLGLGRLLVNAAWYQLALAAAALGLSLWSGLRWLRRRRDASHPLVRSR
jgi:membrane protein DedA with SNARE-associated domain